MGSTTRMPANFEAGAGTGLAELFEPGRVVGDDRALLDRFRRDGSPSAFEGLVVRHGGLVRGVCRRVLGDGPDLDDAFQATFLVLARRAGEVRDPDRLGPWLHGVAARVALKARSRRARRREVAVDPGRFDWPRAERTQTPPDLGELMAILDAELARVAPKLRDAVVLCLLEGATVEEAATRLACPIGTVKSRLARGRAALQTRLIRRGIAPGLAATALASPLASADAAGAATASAPLIRATLALALAPSASVAPTVAALARGVAPTMMTRFAAAASAVVLGGFALAGAYLAAAPQDPAPAPAAVAPGPPSAPAGPDPRALRAASLNNLQQIILGCHVLAGTDPEGRFPAPAIVGTDGQPKLSWRVALLPHIGQEALYKEFHLDEAWDSPHNKTLIERMPAIYDSPDSITPTGTTRFRGFEGPRSMFEGPKGAPLNSVTDGVSHTILLVQVADPVIWTKPGEIYAGVGIKIPSLDGNMKWRRLAMVDGSTLDIAPVPPDQMRAMITRNGGEVIPVPGMLDPSQIPPPPPRPAPAGPSSAPLGAAAPPRDRMAEVEQRLRSVEEKLDRLIQRIEANAGPARGEPREQ